MVNALAANLTGLAPLFEIPNATTIERRVLGRMLRQTAHYIELSGDPANR